ncbi:nucleotidyl transferase AbiEii/AbiGii toxin family protein [Pandoraea sp. PE-S2T-3]|uniref:nucleotidyl transferase AbiEii/AbiGii toxin family protein n=1 Tax=Pandoraea sp. PE-S2T-3 TaxID=1986993 RepID=UPI000B3FD84F|nr:nucleotidyl transferase AbiEii/AbiGii toxin family protein [Pandoraea sp. PE-S2T-3]
MRTISREQLELIDALVAEADLGGLSAAILEKDIHVSDTLQALASLSHKNIRLVFCGGTSLSKAHRLISRMSEDIDLKVVLAPDHGLSQHQLKKRLSALKQQVVDCMKGLGFVEVPEEAIARNANRYFASGWLYRQRYAANTTLRPHLKLEFTTRTPCFATSERSLGYLAHQSAGKDTAEFTMTCVAVEETLAEKVLSFLRRFAEHRAGKRGDWDDALVRHIYDTWCIVKADGAAVDLAIRHFNDLVAFDQDEFTLHAEFCANPAECLGEALEAIGDDQQTIDEYGTKLVPLIYGNDRPSFGEAFGVFKTVARTFLRTIPSTKPPPCPVSPVCGPPH